MGWQHDLAKHIRMDGRDVPPKEVGESRPDVLIEICFVASDWTLHGLTYRSFVVPVGLPDDHHELFRRLTWCVNDRPTSGVERGCLIVQGFSGRFSGTGRQTVIMQVCVRDVPWNHFPGDDGQWRELRDSAGKLAYPEADLSVIPSRSLEG